MTKLNANNVRMDKLRAVKNVAHRKDITVHCVVWGSKVIRTNAGKKKQQFSALVFRQFKFMGTVAHLGPVTRVIWGRLHSTQVANRVAAAADIISKHGPAQFWSSSWCGKLGRCRILSRPRPGCRRRPEAAANRGGPGLSAGPDGGYFSSWAQCPRSSHHPSTRIQAERGLFLGGSHDSITHHTPSCQHGILISIHSYFMYVFIQYR